MKIISRSVALAFLAGAAALPAAAHAQAADAPTCAAVARQAFGSDVKITSASHIAAGPAAPAQSKSIPLPAHCKVEGIVNERIGVGGKRYGISFALALPDDWNGRFLLMGGGGLNGSVAAPTGPTAAGSRPRWRAASRCFRMTADTRARCSTAASWPISVRHSTLRKARCAR